MQASPCVCVALAMAEPTTRWLATFATRRRPTMPDCARLEPCEEAALLVARLVWARRVVNERLSVDLATQLHFTAKQMGDTGAAVLHAIERLIADESSHVALASAVLQTLGGTVPEPHTHDAPKEPAEVVWMRLVLTGLCICETVSAARFAAVREHTDLAGFRACIELFYRDELAHAELGFVLLPETLTRLSRAQGEEKTGELVFSEMRATFAHLDRVIGQELEKTGKLPVAHPQPERNPGVVEPAIDSIAFYRAIHEEILPKLSKAGLPASRAWRER